MQQSQRHETKTDSRALGYAYSQVFIFSSSLSGSLIGLFLAYTSTENTTLLVTSSTEELRHHRRRGDV